VPASTNRTDKSLPTLVSELWDLVVRYAKQEALDPVTSLGRYLLWGVVGSVLLAAGLVLLLFGGLRAAQQELDPHLSGHLTWVPYAMVVVAAGVLMGLLGRRIGAEKRRLDRERTRLRRQEG
jgi:cytochrome c-type biogenesis protein CcmH/NrfF